MRIAIITPYREFPGGVEIVNDILMKLFKNAGYKVDLITTDNFKHNFFTKIMTKIIGLPYITSRRFKKTNVIYTCVIANGEFGWGIEHKNAINLFHGCYKGYRDYLKKEWTLRTYLSLTKEIYIQRISAKNKYVITVSEFIKNILEDDGINVDKVITNSIDTTLFMPNYKIKRDNYLFVGSYNYYAKGFDILEKLADKGFTIDCVTNKKPSSKLGWIQNIDNCNMVEIYNKYKILIFPSRFEGLGLVAIEAMSCGVPIIMNNVGLGVQLKKIIPEFVLDVEDINEFITKIEHIENNYNYFSNKSRKYVEDNHNYISYKNEWISVIKRNYDVKLGN